MSASALVQDKTVSRPRAAADSRSRFASSPRRGPLLGREREEIQKSRRLSGALGSWPVCLEVSESQRSLSTAQISTNESIIHTAVRINFLYMQPSCACCLDGVVALFVSSPPPHPSRCQV